MARPRDTNKIDLIYKAALNLVVKIGYVELKMSDVAKEAGIATGTLYIYFGNKEDLINKLYLHLKKQNTQEIVSKYKAEDGFFINFKRVWYQYLEISSRDSHQMIFLEQYFRSPYLREETKQQTEALLAPIIELIVAGQEQGLVKEVPADILLSYLIGAVNEIVKVHFDKNQKMTQATIDACFEMSWHSIKR
ncbi:MAG TPA: TetR/AcrR family transcriptional regulator [Microscillaceae bacterium]|nr:TetR/AcrR family transcriptional regulator [Microscillaceae bacterium]